MKTKLEHLTEQFAGVGSVAEARKISARIHPSRKWEPLKMLQIKTDATDYIFEYWESTLYSVTVRRFISGSKIRALNQRAEYTYIGIACADGSARHDWRDMQKIKNQIVGVDWEAVELFPAESRLVDPSNLFILWAFPSVPIGLFDGRKVLGPHNCVAPQRGWAKGDEPADTE